MNNIRGLSLVTLVVAEEMGMRRRMNRANVKVLVVMILTIVCTWVFSVSAADKATPAPRYRIILGKGTSVCDAYLKHLNSFSREEPAMLCERKVNPSFSNFTKPEWEEIDLWQHLDWVYEIDYLLNFPNHPSEEYYGYTLEGKKVLSFEDWRKDYESRTRDAGIKPRLYRASLPMEFWLEPPINKPWPELITRPRVWLAYDKGFDRCLDASSEESALVAGGLYNVFVLDESARKVDFQRFLVSWPGSVSSVDLLVYRGKTYFTHIVGNSTNRRKIGTLFIARPKPPLGPEKAYRFEDTCRIEFTYGQPR